MMPKCADDGEGVARVAGAVHDTEKPKLGNALPRVAGVRPASRAGVRAMRARAHARPPVMRASRARSHRHPRHSRQEMEPGKDFMGEGMVGVARAYFQEGCECTE